MYKHVSPSMLEQYGAPISWTIGFELVGKPLDLAHGMIEQGNKLSADMMSKVCKHLQADPVTLKGEANLTQRSYAVAIVRKVYPSESKQQQAARAQQWLQKGKTNEFLEAKDVLEIINKLDPDNKAVFEKYQEQ